MRTSDMKTAIIGPGAMGCLWAAYLKQGGMDVVLLDHRHERAGELVQKGITIRGVQGEINVKVPVTTDARELGPVQLLIILVKAYHTESALREHLEAVDEATAVWSIQNGIGNIETMARVVDSRQLLAGSTTMGANRLDTTTVQHAGEGSTFIGELDGTDSDRVHGIAGVLSAAGIRLEVSHDIQRVIWNKLFVNLGINALTAILRVRNGVLVEHEVTRKLMNAIVEEGVQAARKQGHTFDLGRVQTQVKEVAQRSGQNRSSMLQDIFAGRRTEIEAINGAVCALSDAPVNRILTQLVQALEVTVESRETL